MNDLTGGLGEWKEQHSKIKGEGGLGKRCIVGPIGVDIKNEGLCSTC